MRALSISTAVDLTTVKGPRVTREIVQALCRLAENEAQEMVSLKPELPIIRIYAHTNDGALSDGEALSSLLGRLHVSRSGRPRAELRLSG